jgi:phosphatidylinositol kinase/protein kinase (PI-3  family)
VTFRARVTLSQTLASAFHHIVSSYPIICPVIIISRSHIVSRLRTSPYPILCPVLTLPRSRAQTVSEPEFRIQHYLGTLLRDEMISWHANHCEPFQKSAISNEALVRRTPPHTHTHTHTHPHTHTHTHTQSTPSPYISGWHSPKRRIQTHAFALFFLSTLPLSHTRFLTHPHPRTRSSQVELVERNLGSAVHKLGKLAVCDGTNNAVDSLIKQATSSKHLSDMSPLWHPWL